jgi:Type II secretion system (T2SS), protein G
MFTTQGRSFLLLLLLISMSATVRADLTTKQARRTIATLGGMQLPTDSVHVTKVIMTNAASAEASADLEIVFRLSRNSEGAWGLREVRIGQGSWEDLNRILKAANLQLPENNCNSRLEVSRSGKGSELSFKRARCLIASLFGVSLPSDAVRIKEISGLGLPLGSQPSALAEALVHVDFRLTKSGPGWHVVEFKSGDRSWTRIDAIPTAVDQVKRATAQAELKALATALEAFRRERGSFVISDKHSVLIDHLSPRYLARVTRLDPWNHPYEYQGERDRFTLRSTGPDAKANTPDDIVVSSVSPQ